MKKGLLVFSLILLFAVVLSACSGNGSSSLSPTVVGATSQSGTTTVADGQTLLDTRCASCHSVAKVANVKADATQWQSIVTDMVNRGAVLSSDEEKVLVQYLAANFK